MRAAWAALLLASAAASPAWAQQEEVGDHGAGEHATPRPFGGSRGGIFNRVRERALERAAEDARGPSRTREPQDHRPVFGGQSVDVRGNGGPERGVRPDRDSWNGQRGVRPADGRGWDGRRRTSPDRLEDGGFRAEYPHGRRSREELRVDRRGDGLGAGVPRDRVDPNRHEQWREHARDARRDALHAHRRWDNSWHGDRRYNWRGHRQRYGHLYRAPRYFDPFGYSYGYRRFHIGLRLGRDYYSPRYWINDPFGYRLPQVWGPYRWVRYYDDALLVDVYTGHVVDVVHDFFW